MSTYGVAMVFADGEHPDSRRRPGAWLVTDGHGQFLARESGD